MTFNSERDVVTLPAAMIPSWRVAAAVHHKAEKNLLFRTWGGIGDQICAEPTLRYALKSFRGCRISLASEAPELFSHLKFDEVLDLRCVRPIYENYLLFDTIVNPDHLTWEFFSHCVTNCVDFPSLCALRCQLPVAEREIILRPPQPASEIRPLGSFRNSIYVHPGRHWPSKTFPREWWNELLAVLVLGGHRPILIGGEVDDNRGTVDVNPRGCLDLRGKLSLTDSIWLLQRAGVLLTNDSSPLHMAASRNDLDDATGHAWIGFIATCKHPDYISHFRRGQWAYREVNLGLGGQWEILDHCPNKQQEVTVDKVDPDVLLSWLPDPKSVAIWAIERFLNLQTEAPSRLKFKDRSATADERALNMS